MKYVISDPGTSYKGTRFDWAGVFTSVSDGLLEYAGAWYDTEDPFRHDNVGGMSEEFSPVWIDGKCCKIGVGMLDVERQDEYDRFKLYPISDGGRFEIEESKGRRRTRHLLDGVYDYAKTVEAQGPDKIVVSHTIRNTGHAAIETDCYNHNFFTFSSRTVGPGRRFDFPGAISGHWREDSVPKVEMQGASLVFTGTMSPGEKAFIGDLRYDGMETSGGYSFSVSDSAVRDCNAAILDCSAAVRIRCDKPATRAVFWTNDRVACVEPYVDIRISPGASFGWSIEYTFL